ncbi:MAG: hypothetical protein JWL77_6971 [Chthonomonadaceae bacterium]|nr:hypothetical protein [Chthonomonadaceae bacterium]
MNDEPQGCLFALFRLLGITGPKRQNGDGEVTDEQDGRLWPYRLRDDFLSPAELSFFHVLEHAVGPEYRVCPKVNLADIFFVSSPQENAGFLNKIARKHVDFLLCDPRTLTPLLGIELDDASHRAARREERDRLVEQVFAVAGLRLVRIPAQTSYVPAEVRAAVVGAQPPRRSDLTGQPPDLTVSAQPEPSALAATTPSCPKCSVPMVLRTAQRGDRFGQSFYGCPNYPKCRQVVNVIAGQGT